MRCRPEMTDEEALGFLHRVIKAVPHHSFDFGQRGYCGIGGVVITKAPCAVSHSRPTAPVAYGLFDSGALSFVSK